jgi:PAS domain S-box-containing protein
MPFREFMHRIANNFVAIATLIKTKLVLGDAIEKVRMARRRHTRAAAGTAAPNMLGEVNGQCRDVIQLIPAAIYMTDAKGRITFYNEDAAKLWGCRPELGDSKFCGVWKLYWPDGTPVPYDECPMAMALHQRRPIRGTEAIAERPDGTRIPFIPYPTPLFDDCGRLTGAVNMLVDISERKRAEADLAERQAQLELAGKIARIGSFVYDHGTRILQLSPGCAAIYGLPEGTLEISREDWRGRVHPDDLPQLDVVTRRAITNGEREFVLEFRIFRHGQVRWIESRVLISYNEAGKPVRRTGAAIDVTERKQAEQALAERDIQLTLAAKAGLVGTYAYDVDTEIMQISAGYAAIHGFPEDTTKMARSECLAGAHRDDIGRVEQFRSEAFRAHRREYNVEYRIIRPRGELRWVETRCFLSYNGEGRPHRVVGVSIDITERKRVDEQQRTLLAELDHRVKNALSTVSAVVAHTRQGGGSVADFVVAVLGRIRSMATTHELLSSHRWHGVSLMELVQRELAPYSTRNNTEVKGPGVLLKPEAGRAMAMVLHELATNAAKYGALSSNTGRVLIRWDRRLNGRSLSNLVLEWQEAGGPRVDTPGKSSYGMSTIHDLIPYEFGGTVDLVFAPEGVRCRLELPPDWLINMGEPIEAVADTTR